MEETLGYQHSSKVGIIFMILLVQYRQLCVSRLLNPRSVNQELPSTKGTNLIVVSILFLIIIWEKHFLLYL